MIARRYLLGLALPLAVLGRQGRAADAPGAQGWTLFKSRFLSAEGRIVDTGNGGISHSEGQGYGLLLAALNDDTAAFARILAWTRDNLAVRADGLHAWKWVPQPASAHVPDRNNATDGDLLIAWALSVAAERWQRKDLAEAGRGLAATIRAHCLRRHGDMLLLMPGVDGFEPGGRPIVNLSYWVFPAFGALSRLDASPDWSALQNSGRRLVELARFGRWRLPPDWLALDPPGPAPGFSFEFGFNAVRIPLYLIWAGITDPGLLSPFDSFWRDGGANPPATVELKTDKPASFSASVGVKAIAAQTAATLSHQPAELPALTPELDYYSAVLLLLTQQAAVRAARP